jgi:hypothetical protein
MTTSKIGGSESKNSHFRLYVFGLVLGTLIRITAFLAPVGVVRRLEDALLPDGTETTDSQQSN